MKTATLTLMVLACMTTLAFVVGLGFGVGVQMAVKPTADRLEKAAMKLEILIGRFLP